MNPVSYAFSIAAAAIAFVVVLELLRRGRFRERHAMWWILAASLALLIALFPAVLEWAAALLGIAVPANLAFFASIVILFFATIQHSSELTQLEEKTRVLAENVALLTERLNRTTSGDENPPARDDAE